MNEEQIVLKELKQKYDMFVSCLVVAANIILIFCGGAIAIFPETALTPWPYFGFAIGHAMWLLIGVIWERSGLILLNVAFILLDTYGVYIRLFGG